MFRTWGANYIFLQEIIKQKDKFMSIANLKTDESDNKQKNSKKIIEKESEKIIKDILQTIALRLHNTATVSKKSYLDNNLIQIYLDKPRSFWNKINKSKKSDLNVLLSEFLNKNCDGNTNNNNKSKKNQKGGWSLLKLIGL
jgi:DNA topoisomerase IB